MRRFLIALGFLCVVTASAAYWWISRSSLVPLTPQAIAALEPETCSASPLRIFLTIIPTALPRSYTDDLTIEQIALIDEYKPNRWRKIWVLRVPTAFITGRTCDSGRTNWVGDGDDRTFSQRYEMDLAVTKDDVVPLTRVDQSQRDSGAPVRIVLTNSVGVPERLWRGFGRRSFVNDNYRGDRDPPKCSEEESQFPGLTIFRRINSEERGGMHCGGTSGAGTKWEEKVYGRKIGDQAYEFVVQCSVNCHLYGEYRGWNMELWFEHKDLARWSLVVSGVRRFLDQMTVAIDHDDGTGQR